MKAWQTAVFILIQVGIFLSSIFIWPEHMLWIWLIWMFGALCFYAGFYSGMRCGWYKRERGYEAACFANQEAVEKSK